MAINLSILQANGVTTTYNRITDVRLQPKGSLNIQISSYVSQAVRESGGLPVIQQYVPLDVSQIDLSQPILSQCYSQLLGGLFSGGTVD